MNFYHRCANERSSLNVIGDSLDVLNHQESALRNWLKSKCNENNRADEADLMDLVDDCFEAATLVSRDYLSI